MPETADRTLPSVLVVGAGALGVSIAAALVRTGHVVTLVDGAEAGTGTTDCSYAWINANSKAPEAYAELNLHGLRAHQRWSARAGRPWFHQTGQLQLLTTSGHLAEAEEQVARYLEAGYPAQLLTAAETAERAPGARTSDVLGGVFFPLEGWADTSVMVSGLLHEVIAGGARYLPYHRVLELTGSGAVAQGPDGGPQALAAEVTVLAAGNGNRSLAATLGSSLPVLPAGQDGSGAGGAGGAVTHAPTIGMVCTTSPVAGVPETMVHTPEVSLRPASNGGVMLTDHPTASSWGEGSAGLWSAPEILLRRARERFPALEAAEIAAVRTGHRVLPEDGLTIADWLDAGQRHYAVATHSGITLAPHLGEVIAAEIGGNGRSPSLRDFGLDRFSAVPA